MFRRLDNRLGHYLLLVFVWAALGLPDLGGPTLWDVDEGANAEASRMMLESGNYLVPTFNGELRVDKPALLYWLQVAAYRVVGVNELGARLPSALAALATALFTYELARRQFGPGCGLMAGVVLASSVAFCLSGHFANPDALLLACTAGTFFVFWRGFTGPRLHFVSLGIAMGLGVLAKGLVGIVLPCAVIGLFLLWSWQWRRLLDWGLLWGLGAFFLVVAPWYGWVAAETKMGFIQGFIFKHHFERFLTPMENHHGAIWYYLPVIFLGFMPWAALMGLGCWSAWPFRRRRATTEAPPEAEMQARRFIWCWVLVYLLFFTVASTKLPNYILPVYVPLAAFLGHFLDRWRRGVVVLPAWMMGCGMAYLALVGVGYAVGALIGGGRLTLPFLDQPPIPGLEWWAPLGLIPLAGAVGGVWRLWRQDRSGVVAAVAASAVLFVGTLAGTACRVLEPEKSPQTLALAVRRQQTEQDIRLACYAYWQPSLVYYCRREVERFDSRQQAREFLKSPLEVYLCVPEPVWERELKPIVRGNPRVIARRPDLYHKCDILVVTNR